MKGTSLSKTVQVIFDFYNIHRSRGAFLVLMVDDDYVAELLGGVERLAFVDLPNKPFNTLFTVEEGVGDQFGCVVAAVE